MDDSIFGITNCVGSLVSYFWGIRISRKKEAWWHNPDNQCMVYLSVHLIFPYIGNNNPNWLSYFSERLVYHQPVIVGTLCTYSMEDARVFSSMYRSSQGHREMACLWFDFESHSSRSFLGVQKSFCIHRSHLFTLWWFNGLLWQLWPIEIDDLNHGLVISQFATLNNQRVSFLGGAPKEVVWIQLWHMQSSI